MVLPGNSLPESILYLSWTLEVGMLLESGEKDNHVRLAGLQ